MKVKVFGMLAAIQVKVFSALQEIAKPTDEGILDWLLTDGAQTVIIKACQAAWDVLVDDYEKFTNRVLEFLGTVTIPATTEPFVAREKFKLKQDGGICYDFGPNFIEWFLSGEGKIEDPTARQTLRCHELRKVSIDDSIINELGGGVKVETTLTAMFFLMEKQNNGEAYVLLTKGWANIFYIKDLTGVLRAVGARWSGDGWSIYASPVKNQSTWSVGCQVFSRLPAGQAGNSEPSVV